MTTAFLPLTDTREFQRLFVAQETASHALTCATAANPQLEFDDPATWQPLETAMNAAYAAFTRYVNAHTRPAGCPRSVPSVDVIRANGRYDAAQVAYMEAGAELDKVAHIGPGEAEYFLYEAADAHVTAARDALEAAIDAHCAEQVYKALVAVTPLPREKADADTQGTLTELAAMLTWGQDSKTNVVILAPNHDPKADTAFYQLKQGDAPGNYVLMQVRGEQDTPQAA